MSNLYLLFRNLVLNDFGFQDSATILLQWLKSGFGNQVPVVPTSALFCRQSSAFCNSVPIPGSSSPHFYTHWDTTCSKLIVYPETSYVHNSSAAQYICWSSSCCIVDFRVRKWLKRFLNIDFPSLSHWFNVHSNECFLVSETSLEKSGGKQEGGRGKLTLPARKLRGEPNPLFLPLYCPTSQCCAEVAAGKSCPTPASTAVRRLLRGALNL